MEHNIFISYAWVDNEVYPGAQQGWVSTFVDGLRKHLAHELGRRDEGHLWLDYEQMRGNEGLTPTIRAHLRASRTLVLILSNGYLASPWCRQELEAFVAMAGADSGRLFVVQMSPVEQEPEVLRDLLKYSFWYWDERHQPRTRWFPYIDPTDRDYSPQQQSLARDLAATLRPSMQPPGPGHDHPAVASPPFAPEGPAPDPGPEDAPEPQPRGGRMILVNGGADDRELVRAIAQRLERHRLGVAVPLAALGDHPGIKSSALTRDLRDKLALCDAVLMVYRQGPVDQVSQHLVECLKACTRAPRGKVPPTIDLCQTQSDALALGLRPQGMRIHVICDACPDECVERFLNETAP